MHLQERVHFLLVPQERFRRKAAESHITSEASNKVLNAQRSGSYIVCFRLLFSLASSSQAPYLSRLRLQNMFARALNHFAAPPLPKKSCRLSVGPGMYCLHSKISRFHLNCRRRPVI